MSINATPTFANQPGRRIALSSPQAARRRTGVRPLSPRKAPGPRAGACRRERGNGPYQWRLSKLSREVSDIVGCPLAAIEGECCETAMPMLGPLSGSRRWAQ